MDAIWYDREPRYPVIGGSVADGWSAAVASAPATPFTLALDGPANLPWDAMIIALTSAFTGRTVTLKDTRGAYALSETDDDPHFTKLPSGTLADLLREPLAPPAGADVRIVYGPGAALAATDLLWYADIPKRYAEAEIAAGGGVNLGTENATLRRLFYVDWPLLDAHRDAIAPRIDRWIDLQDGVRSISGPALRESLAMLATSPVRTRPYFNSTPWGGHWAQRELGFSPDATNTALGYELIAPESGILLGESAAAPVEVPFQLLVVLHPDEMMGAARARFGTSFPIRFDYLDTDGGDNLSLHCHPKERYMREVFGWPYTQHETYYLVSGTPGSRVFLGLRSDVDTEVFRKQVERAVSRAEPVEVTEHVQTFAAEPGQLFMIPAGTPHASGAGNVVLEISATPYLYSLRFYDWLRLGLDGKPRPLPYEHGFANLETERIGRRVAAELVQQPRQIVAGDGWDEQIIGALDEMFYEVRRLRIAPDATAKQDTAGHFHVLNVTSGAGVVVETATRTHRLARAETLTIPAAVGPYEVRVIGDQPVQVVKAWVP